MGPSLARMAQRGLDEAGSQHRVIAVSRFAGGSARDLLEQAGIRTLAADLLDAAAVRGLPEAGAVVFLAGAKFGSTDAPARTWAVNAWLPGLIAERYTGVRTVVLSSGNVYPLVDTAGRGADERTTPAPIGDYAWSVLARERVFEHFSREHGTPIVSLRLNYAVELRYGVLLDIAQKVWEREPIDLTTGHVNVVWQADANAFALRSLALAASPPDVLNVTGADVLSVRQLAMTLGELLERTPVLIGEEAKTALLSDAARCHDLFGPPSLPTGDVVRMVAEWVKCGGNTLGKPTRYEVRDGKF